MLGGHCPGGPAGEPAQDTAPTLVVAGADDPATPPEHSEVIASGIGDNAHLEILPHSAHMATIEQAAEFNRLFTLYQC